MDQAPGGGCEVGDDGGALGEGASGRHRVEVAIEAPAETVRRHVGRWARVDARTPGSCTMTMDTDSLDGPIYALGAGGAEFTVVTPPGLVARCADWGSRFTRAGVDPAG